eukprot:TRINITY_DN51059_c0_g1_i1.p1 TRINITY_DN51059_c0_g1~~TRINITY_DN51059_c0_g1_i1.p1  ORF type:complete len:177 (+),score=37.58 TRINITY_DN51059_c0_g1_i1:169-699(+)
MAEHRDYVALINECEAREVAGDQKIGGIRLHMTYCLLQNDLNRARFLWKRADSFQKDAELKALWDFGQAMWNKDWAAAFAVRVPGTGEVATLLPELEETTRMRALFLIASAYEDIRVNAAAALLGLSPDATVDFCQKFGWACDGVHLTPCATESVDATIQNLEAASGLAQIAMKLD